MKLVSRDELKTGMIAGKDIPAREGGTIPLVRKGAALTKDMIGLMRKYQIQFAYITDRPLGKHDSPKRIYIPASKPSISGQLRDSAIVSLEKVFKNALIGASDIHVSTIAVIKDIDDVVSKVVDALDGQAMVGIMNLKSYDDYTYSHSLSVAVISTAIGEALGMGHSDLRRLCKSAILHDIGKASVPIELINKPTRLDSDEFSIIKQHPIFGYGYLSHTSAGDEDLLRAVIYHHERVDGSGYPHGFKGNKIPLWSRIIAVADVYDALTSNRPYRVPFRPGEAIEYLMGGVGKAFDYDVTVGFLRKVDVYPIGSVLSLSNGKTAVVYNNENTLRPVVRILSSGEVVDLYRDRKYLSVTISGVDVQVNLRENQVV